MKKSKYTFLGREVCDLNRLHTALDVLTWNAVLGTRVYEKSTSRKKDEIWMSAAMVTCILLHRCYVRMLK
jgi:hypothetical protein